jgi:RNA-directed DNA polymerase
MKAVQHHTDCKWLILYIERWLTTPFQLKNGEQVERLSGTPQGGVISPLLSNLFLHYVFDKWMTRENPHNPWARYADDGIVHCRSQRDAQNLLGKLDKRFKECCLEIHPEKTQIVYCKDDDRQGNYPVTKFDFLGYTFRPRRAKNKYGKYFITFTPAVSNSAQKFMRQKIRSWRVQLKSDKSLEDLSRMFDPVIRGWMNYYSHFYKSATYPVLRHFDNALAHWACRKFKKLRGHKRRARHWLGRVARREPTLFTHWSKGILPSAG